MNADTGRMYFTAEEVEAARQRGENLVDLDRAHIEEAIRQSRIDQTMRAAFGRNPVAPMTRGQYRRSRK